MRRAKGCDRSGQALLLAVLVMVLLALVAAAFVAVIAYSLTHAARHEEVVAAEEAARAGIRYADDQLGNSDEGADWRPVPPPAPGSPTYGNYFDTIEQIRGWAPLGFSKYPNPLEPDATTTDNPDMGGTRFLLKVTPPTTPTPGNPLAKYLRIESVGRSSANPSVFRMLVAYKLVGLADNALFVTDYTSTTTTGFLDGTARTGMAPRIDFDPDSVLATAATAGSTTITVANVNPFLAIPPANFGGTGCEVKIGYGPIAAGGVAELQTIDPGPPPAINAVTRVITLTAGLSNDHPAGTPVDIDWNNNDAVDQSDEGIDASTGDEDEVVYDSSLTPVADSERVRTQIYGPVRFNGKATWFGNVSIYLTSATDDRVQIAGGATLGPGPVTEDATGGNATAVQVSVDGASPTTVAPSVPAGSFVDVSGRYEDGYGFLTNDTSSAAMWRRRVRPERPPVIAEENPSSGLARAERFEHLTRFSSPQTAVNPSPGALGTAGLTLSEVGYGQGMFFNNSADVQFAAALPATRRTSLVAQWVTGRVTAGDSPSDGSAVPYWRNHLEYVPSGVEIILTDNDLLPNGTTDLGASATHIDYTVGAATVANTGAPHTANHPVIWFRRDDAGASTWYDYTGTADVDATQWLSIDYPQNGVIFALGNVRIKGNLPASYVDVTGAAITREFNLTVVSLGTIYIEGNILTPQDRVGAVPNNNNTHIALVAKDHVCLNTTQFMYPSVPAVGTEASAIADTAYASQTSDTVHAPHPDDLNESCWRLARSGAATLNRSFSSATTAAGSTQLVVRHAGERRVAFELQTNPADDAGLPPLLAADLEMRTDAAYNLLRTDLAPPPHDPRDFDDWNLATGTTIETIGELAGPPPGVLQTFDGDGGGNVDYLVSSYNVGAAAVPSMKLAIAGNGTLDTAPPPTDVDIKSDPTNAQVPFSFPLVTAAQALLNTAVPSGFNTIGSDADLVTARHEFYQHWGSELAIPAWTMNKLVTRAWTLPTGTGSGEYRVASGATNRVTFQTVPGEAEADYRLGRFKIQRLDATGSAGYGLDIRISALIYAQEGTFFVIPGVWFDEAASNWDVDGDGTLEAGENESVFHRRYNYRITLNGAVNISQSPDEATYNTATNPYGLYQTQWTDHWASPSYTTDVNGDGTTGDAGYVWTGLRYYYDPQLRNYRDPVAIVGGGGNTLSKIPKLPAAPGLVYVG